MQPQFPQYNIEHLLRETGTSLIKGHQEDQKINRARIAVHAERIRDKREERIEHLKKGLRAATSGHACIKIFRPVFEVFDLLLKPLTAISAGQLRFDLSSMLDKLQQGLNQQKKLGYQIKNKQLMLVMNDLKGLLSEDFNQLDQSQQQQLSDVQRIRKILDQIQSTVVSHRL